ncbi:hypothetical protein ABZZ79_36215 [Streptomyces sp. NPDC006458]|uniref:hypothetical protein n=1 Tax=Streptomyces sp. NPDC006458 TaxID=3154302 RepID=UPI0033B6CA30
MVQGISASTTALDSATRTATRVRLLFSLTGRIDPALAIDRLIDRLDFGRFGSHLRSGDTVLPVPVLAESVDPADLGLPGGDHGLRLAGAGMVVVTTPRGDATLVLDCDFAVDTSTAALAPWLAATCFEREAFTLGGRPLLDVVRARLALPEPLAFGQNVHQLVLPGGQLLAELLTAAGSGRSALAEPLNELIYRGKLPGAPRPGISVPPHLYIQGVTLAAHGRGVSVQAGWAPHVENALTLVAVGMLSALAVLQRTRLKSFEMMRLNQQATTGSPRAARELISELSAGVNELQLDLAFGVEAYVDSLLIPEMLTEGFQSSLGESFGIRDSLENSARMIERLTSVIAARSASHDAALADEKERRDGIVSGLLAVATLIALPPTLLLAFFGANASDIDDSHSVLDVGEYGWAYAAAWLPFVLLVAVGWLRLRRRPDRDRGPAPSPGPQGTPPGPAPASPLPAPRPPAGP